MPQQTPLLSQVETTFCIVRYQQHAPNAMECAEKLLAGNVGLVSRIVHRYLTLVTSLDFDDLYIAGQLGLLQAAERFDTTRGLRFSTYAAHWIKRDILRAIEDTDDMVRIPPQCVRDMTRRTDARNALRLESGQEPAAEAVARRAGFSLKYLHYLATLPDQPLSLDAPAGDSGDERHGDLLADPQDAPSACLTAIWLTDLMDRAGLTPRERSVLILRYGLAGPAYTLEETRAVIGMRSRQGVAHVEARALVKLRAVHERDDRES